MCFIKKKNIEKFFCRCIALKTSVDQLKERLQSSAITETELRSELSCLQKDHVEHSHTINSNQDKLKHLQKALSNCDNEKRILHERFESAQNMIKELQLNHHGLQDNSQRLQNRISELEVQKSTLEAQMRIYKTNPTSDEIVPESYNDLTSQLLKCQREKNEFRLKIEMLNERLRKSEIEQFGKSTGTEIDSNRLYDSGLSGKDQTNYKLEYSLLKQENHDLKIKIRRLETLLAEKESELARLRASLIDNYKSHSQDRSSQLLDTREQHHRQQVTQLENQVFIIIIYFMIFNWVFIVIIFKLDFNAKRAISSRIKTTPTISITKCQSWTRNATIASHFR